MLSFYIWNIWIQGNSNRFNAKTDHIPFFLVLSQGTEFHIIISLHNNANKSTITSTTKWEPPARGSFKLNTDGATDTKNNAGGQGGVIRDHSGNRIIGFTFKTPCTNPVLVELLALMMGLHMAHDHNLKPLEINIDALEVITMLRQDNPVNANILHECRSLIRKVEEAHVTHIFREQNQVADGLSKKGARSNRFGMPLFLSVPPVYASKSFWVDIDGTT